MNNKPKIRAYSKQYFQMLGFESIIELEPFGRCAVLREEYDKIMRESNCRKLLTSEMAAKASRSNE